MKISSAVAASQSIGAILNTKLPIKASYHLSKIGKVIKDELTTYDEARIKLIKELGEEIMADAPGHTEESPKPKIGTGQYQVAAENIESFTKQHDELMDVEIKIDLDKLKVSSLGDKAEIAPTDFIACADLFED